MCDEASFQFHVTTFHEGSDATAFQEGEGDDDEFVTEFWGGAMSDDEQDIIKELDVSVNERNHSSSFYVDTIVGNSGEHEAEQNISPVSKKRKICGKFLELTSAVGLSGRAGSKVLRFIDDCFDDLPLLPADIRAVKKHAFEQACMRSAHKTLQPTVRDLPLKDFPGLPSTQTCSFAYWSISDCIRTLVENTPPGSTFVGRDEDVTPLFDATGGRRIEGLWTGNAWLRGQEFVRLAHGAAAVFIAIMLYVDKTTMRSILGLSYYPVVVQIGNHEVRHRHSKYGKMVVAFLPVVKKPKSLATANLNYRFQMKNIRLLHMCWEVIVRDFNALSASGCLYPS